MKKIKNVVVYLLSLIMFVSSCSINSNKQEHQHTPGRQIYLNEIAATCTENGSYDLVTYCEECGEEINREHKTIDPLGHDYVLTHSEPPTNNEDGYNIYTCSRCGDTYTETIAHEHIHVQSDPVYENKKEPTCTENGSYDLVAYCVECGEEVYREHKTIDSLGHDYVVEKTIYPTDEEDGSCLYRCSRCNETVTRPIAFLGNFTYSMSKDGLTIIKYFGEDIEQLIIPSFFKINGEDIPVVAIEKNCFYNCTSLKSINIIGSIKTIDSSTFYGCSSLTSITIPDSVTSIKEKAFYNCKSLKTITVPNGASAIAKSAFEGCSSLESIILPSISGEYLGYIFGASSYSENSKYIPSSLKTVIISGACKTIERFAFYKCSFLESIIIPDSVTSIGESAFSGCSSLVSMNIPAGITSIKESLFSGCLSLVSIFIPEGVKSIARYAFSSCSSLANISVPNSVEKIEKWAFFNCLRSAFTYYGGAYYLGNDANPYVALIDVNYHMQEFEINKDCLAIAEYAFSWFSEERTSVTIILQEGISSIGQYAFADCKSLKSIIIPDSVTSIGQSAFEGCSSLESITLPFVGGSATSYRYLGYIFGSVSESVNSSKVPNSLKTIIISDACKSISSSAFNGCSSLESIILGNKITSIYDSAFNGCDSLRYNIYKNAYYLGSKDNPYFALIKVANNQVTEYEINDNCSVIASLVFWNFNKLQYITIPNNITGIGNSAFNNCKSLKAIYYYGSLLNWIAIKKETTFPCSVHLFFDGSEDETTAIIIPDGVTYIEERAFYNCTSLTSIIIPNSVTSIGQSAFYGCSSLESITLPFAGGSMTENQYFGYLFGAARYDDNSTNVPKTLRIVTITNSFTKMHTAFRGCSSIKTINYYGSIADWLSDEGNDYLCRNGEVHLFLNGNNDETTSIIVPENILIIGKYAFCSCSSLTSITIPNGVTSIGYYAFYGCSSLTSITIPNGVTSIGSYAFYSCSSLTSIDIPVGITNIGESSFSGCSSLTSITIPNGVTTIWKSTFYDCSSLTSVTIPNGVTSIREIAFCGCSSLTSVTIPNSVTHIGRSAFYRCSSLTEINYGGTIQEWNAIKKDDRLFDDRITIICSDGKTYSY